MFCFHYQLEHHIHKYQTILILLAVVESFSFLSCVMIALAVVRFPVSQKLLLRQQLCHLILVFFFQIFLKLFSYCLFWVVKGLIYFFENIVNTTTKFDAVICNHVVKGQLHFLLETAVQ